MPGFTQVEGGNFDALAAAVDDETAGIIMEPIQGEGGINFYPEEFPGKVRKLCDEPRAHADLRRRPHRLRPDGRLLRISGSARRMASCLSRTS